MSSGKLIMLTLVVFCTALALKPSGWRQALAENSRYSSYREAVTDHGGQTRVKVDQQRDKGPAFTKLNNNGKALSPVSATWSCVQDNATGLIWEIKTDDGGLRDKDNSFTWHDPDPATNGGVAGTRNGGRCTGGISCDTTGYVTAVNAAGLCGARNWRLPTKDELSSLVDHTVADPGPKVNGTLFPDTTPWNYWAGSPVTGNANSAWNVGFSDGEVYQDAKSYDYGVRLVRSKPR